MSQRARKRFGQHFLHDPSIIARIVAAIDPVPDQRMVEIGPGHGAITRPLLERLASLDVIEIDRDVIAGLEDRCRGAGPLTVHNADALRFDYRMLIPPEGRLRVVGNLPYNISTPLLFHILAFSAGLQDMHFLLQRELVDRLTAAPGGRTYGRLSVMVQYRCRAQRLFTVKNGSFKPPPAVDSALVRLIPHRASPVTVNNEALFDRIVRQAFTQRRKTLRNALKPCLGQEAIESAGIDPGQRPESLSLQDFASLANRMTH